MDKAPSRSDFCPPAVSSRCRTENRELNWQNKLFFILESGVERELPREQTERQLIRRHDVGVRPNSPCKQTSGLPYKDVGLNVCRIKAEISHWLLSPASPPQGALPSSSQIAAAPARQDLQNRALTCEQTSP